MFLPALVFVALAVFAGALLWSPLAGRAAYLHLMLAVGAVPLIFGAMSHFIPVLTRTRTATAGFAIIPVLALAGGVLAVAGFSVSGMVWGWQAGALVAMAAASALLAWSWRRRKAMLGRPHPCLAWYEVALACLATALLAILASAVWPQQLPALRRFHLHLNTLGFIGMTAVSTLAVLMPTVTGKADPQAGPTLRRDLPWAATGTLLVAFGSGWFGPLAWVGAVLWANPVLRMGTRWLRLYRREILTLHGAAPPLAAALSGFALCIVLGAIAPLARTGGSLALDPAATFATGFLLPLVTGAASQLLPVWLKPGVQQAWHADLHRKLGRYGGVRAVLFLIGGMAAGLGGEFGLLLGAATLIWFLLQAAISLLRTTTIQQGQLP